MNERNPKRLLSLVVEIATILMLFLAVAIIWCITQSADPSTLKKFGDTANTITAVVGLIALIVLIVYTRETFVLRLAAERQTAAAITAAEAAKKSADAFMNSERAWLLIEKISLSELVPIESGDTKPVYCMCQVKNYGKAPAKVTAVRTVLETRTKRDASDGRLDETIYTSSDSDMVARIVVPGEMFYIEQRPAKAFLSGKDIAAINCEGEDRAFFFAHGIIKYSDGFHDEPKVTRFCYRYDIEYFVGPGRSGFYFAERPMGYNEAT